MAFNNYLTQLEDFKISRKTADSTMKSNSTSAPRHWSKESKYSCSYTARFFLREVAK